MTKPSLYKRIFSFLLLMVLFSTIALWGEEKEWQLSFEKEELSPYPLLPEIKPLSLPREARIDKRLLFLLLRELKDRNPLLRYRAARTLGLVRDEKRIPRIKRALKKRLRKEKHPQIKRVLADSLSRIEIREQAQERRKRR